MIKLSLITLLAYQCGQFARALHPYASNNSTSALPQNNVDCPYPATCTPPTNYAFQKIMKVSSRTQWGDSGGYCGSLSVQAIAMNFGCWISQSKVRKAAKPGGGHGDPTRGYEILHTNIGGALDALKLTHNDWNYSQPFPQVNGYLKWLKEMLISGNPVVWMIMCKGDSHDTYGLAEYDHVEPVWGLMSQHSLNDTIPYADDVLIHGADYGASDTTEGPSLYRRFDSLADSKSMDGNCSKAQAGYGRNEFYPCTPNDGPDYGFAITGVSPNSLEEDERLWLSVDRFDEPDINRWQKPALLHGTVTIDDLVVGEKYYIYRWDDVANIPLDQPYSSSKYTHVYSFNPTAERHVFKDPNTFLSSGTTYYRCVRANK